MSASPVAPPFSSILFDLDGTIVDSAPGITSSLAHTYEALGMPVPTPAELLRWVGPPILDSFRDLAGLNEAESARALEIYRKHYVSTGVFDAVVYPGVREILAAIHDAGIPLSLATSKPELPARLVLDHFELSQYFTEFTGASEDESRSAKKDVVLEALRRLRLAGADLGNPIMVGDRHHDVEGAHERGIPTFFVTWGYGSPAEQVGAVGAAETPRELAALLGLEASAAA